MTDPIPQTALATNTIDYFGLPLTVVVAAPEAPPKKKRSQAWKDFEVEITKVLQAMGFNVRRDNRGDDYGRLGFEIIFDALPFLKIDCKYREGGWAHHSVIEADIIDKYCNAPGDEPVMPTKSKRQHGSYTTIRTSFFVRLLRLAFFARELPSAKWGCNRCGAPLTMKEKAVGNLHRYDCPECGLAIFSESEPQNYAAA